VRCFELRRSVDFQTDSFMRLQKRPHLSSVPKGLEWPTNSTIQIYNIVRSEVEKSQSFSHDIKSFNTTVSNITVADDRSNIPSRLSPPEPRLRHQDIQERTVGNVGEWFLQTEQYKNWYARSGQVNSMTQFCFAIEIRGWGRHIGSGD